jgi:hypothetical protein
VARELIALSHGEANDRPVLGMFLGGAGLADSMLYCRNKIYPLGLPNSISHVLTAFAVLFTLVFGIRADFLPERARPVRVSLIRQGNIEGAFSLLIVTTLQRLLLGSQVGIANPAMSGALKLMAVEQNALALTRAIVAGLFGRVGHGKLAGVHVQRGDEIRIEGDRSSVILDGELFEARKGRPIVLTPTGPVPFLRLAA